MFKTLNIFVHFTEQNTMQMSADQVFALSTESSLIIVPHSAKRQATPPELLGFWLLSYASELRFLSNIKIKDLTPRIKIHSIRKKRF